MLGALLWLAACGPLLLPVAAAAQGNTHSAKRDTGSDKRSGSAARAIARARRHFEQGRRAYLQDRLDRALWHFEQAYAIAPSAELAYNLARVLERMGKPRQSAHYYRVYLQQGPEDEAERVEIERRLSKLEELDSRQSEQALKPAPTRVELTDEARVFFLRGVKLFRKHRYEDALVAFGAAQRFAPLPELSYNMALAEEHLGRSARAIDHYRAYLRSKRRASDEAEVRARIEALLAR